MIFPLFEGLSLSHVGRYPDFWHHTYRLAFPDSYENQVAIEVSYPVTVAALSPILTAFPAPTRSGLYPLFIIMGIIRSRIRDVVKRSCFKSKITPPARYQCPLRRWL